MDDVFEILDETIWFQSIVQGIEFRPLTNENEYYIMKYFLLKRYEDKYIPKRYKCANPYFQQWVAEYFLDRENAKDVYWLFEQNQKGEIVNVFGVIYFTCNNTIKNNENNDVPLIYIHYRLVFDKTIINPINLSSGKLLWINLLYELNKRTRGTHFVIGNETLETAKDYHIRMGMRTHNTMCQTTNIAGTIQQALNENGPPGPNITDLLTNKSLPGNNPTFLFFDQSRFINFFIDAKEEANIKSNNNKDKNLYKNTFLEVIYFKLGLHLNKPEHSKLDFNVISTVLQATLKFKKGLKRRKINQHNNVSSSINISPQVQENSKTTLLYERDNSSDRPIVPSQTSSLIPPPPPPQSLSTLIPPPPPQSYMMSRIPSLHKRKRGGTKKRNIKRRNKKSNKKTKSNTKKRHRKKS